MAFVEPLPFCWYLQAEIMAIQLLACSNENKRRIRGAIAHSFISII
jgi:hypothetical protein